MSKPTGGPAFPVSIDPRVGFPTGMTKRDVFAMNAAIDGINLDYDQTEQLLGREISSGLSVLEQLQIRAEAVAKIRFMIADAMLAESHKE